MFKISTDALDFIKEKLGEGAVIHVTLSKKGCAGAEYNFIHSADAALSTGLDQVAQDGVTVLFDPILSLSLVGATLIVRRDGFNTRLDFDNPNEQGRCGCGASVKF